MCYSTVNKEDCEIFTKGKVTFDTPVVWKEYKQSAEAAQCKL
jgi:hypothetical protein